MEKERFQVRYNAMQITSLTAFANLKGGWSEGVKQVYFVRCIGYDGSYLRDIEGMDRALTGTQGEGRIGYSRIGRPGQPASPEEIAYYTEAYRTWEDSAGRALSLKSVNAGSGLGAEAREALNRVLDMFKSCTPNASQSIIKNFIIKMFYWTDQVIPQLCPDWIREGTYKLAVTGALKKQEYLFCYFLTLLGVDVVILSPEKELEIEDALLKLSCKLELEKNGKLEFPPYVREKMAQQPAAARVVIPPRKSREKPAPVVSQAAKADRERREKTFEELALLASSIVMISIHDNHNQVMGSGSGIMVGTEGYILTNNHVACGGACYSVRIEDDDRVYRTSEVIKYHSVLDLALIRIDRRLKPLPIYRGDRELVRGQRVVAIGSPLGFFNSVSDGIISGFRKIRDVDMIQFTAPISHGSSGGALLNMYGEVIGISTAGVDNGQNINLAVDYRDIYNFVRGFL